MKRTDLRWGVLGVAKINDRILPSFPRAKHARLHGIASRNLEKAQAAATKAGIPKAYGSYEALLADPDIDVVYIPLPNTMHDEWTRKAADSGKHVLCEKPLTPTAPMAAELVDYCHARGVMLMDGFMWPHHPRTRRIRSLIDAGAIGEVQQVRGAFTFPLPLDPGNIRLRSDMAGGSLLDVGCYPVFGIRWAFGAEPVRVYATAKYDYEVDVQMSGLLWLADGRNASFDCGFTSPLRQWLEIVGTTGVIRVPEMWVPGPTATFAVERDGKPEIHTTENEDQIAHMLDDLSRAVLEGQPVYPDPRNAAATLRVLDALARSAAEGREMDV
jgi:predicted dehydrogenase